MSCSVCDGHNVDCHICGAGRLIAASLVERIAEKYVPTTGLTYQWVLKALEEMQAACAYCVRTTKVFDGDQYGGVTAPSADAEKLAEAIERL